MSTPAYRDEDVALINSVMAPAGGTVHERVTFLVTDRGPLPPFAVDPEEWGEPLRVRLTATNNADAPMRRFAMVCERQYRKWAERRKQALPPHQRRAAMFAKRFRKLASERSYVNSELARLFRLVDEKDRQRRAVALIGQGVGPL